MCTGPPGLFVAGLVCPAATDDVAVPAQDGLRRDNQTQASTTVLRDDVDQTAMKARSAQVILGRTWTWRCNTTSWWRSSRISADFHDSERSDSRSQPNSRLTIK